MHKKQAWQEVCCHNQYNVLFMQIQDHFMYLFKIFFFSVIPFVHNKTLYNPFTAADGNEVTNECSISVKGKTIQNKLRYSIRLSGLNATDFERVPPSKKKHNEKWGWRHNVYLNRAMLIFWLTVIEITFWLVTTVCFLLASSLEVFLGSLIAFFPQGRPVCVCLF